MMASASHFACGNADNSLKILTMHVNGDYQAVCFVFPVKTKAMTFPIELLSVSKY